jgi:hypothetical protein
VKDNRQPALLSDTGTADLAGLSEHDRSLWNKYVLVVM